MSGPVVIALDSGTSVVKAVAFAADGRMIASSGRPNAYLLGPGGAAEQDLTSSWDDACAVLSELTARLEGCEIVALGVTGQGDGTWLIDAEGAPVGPGLLWLDARAAGLVETLRGNGAARAAFAHTGSGLAAAPPGPNLGGLRPPGGARRDGAATAFHCKDWLYFRLTGERATDPSEGNFSFGDWRTRGYRAEVLAALGLAPLAHLLPPIVDGTTHSRPLGMAAAARTGLPAGLPVMLGYVDVVCAALGAGLYGAGEAGVSIIGSTGMHLRLLADPAAVAPSPAMTGYCMAFPVPGHTMQAQTNMAATLNIDWIAELARQAAALSGAAPSRAEMLRALDEGVAGARPGAVVFHPFISLAGERGPFTDAYARASAFGIDQRVGLMDLARGVYEGLGFAARDCYAAAGGAPAEIRVSGGAARSAPMRAILAACLDRNLRGVAQPEAGAAGAAMIAAVCAGLYPDMAACAAAWIGPLLGPLEPPDPALVALYDRLFPIYRDGYAAMPDLWRRLHAAREDAHAA